MLGTVERGYARRRGVVGMRESNGLTTNLCIGFNSVVVPCVCICASYAGGEGQAVATTLLGLLLRLGAPSPSSPSSVSPPLLLPSSATEKDENTEQYHEAQHESHGKEQAPAAIQQQPGGWGDDGIVVGGGSGEHKHGGWQEFGGNPGRLVAEHTARLLSVLVSMSKARSYVLGEVRKGASFHSRQDKTKRQASSLLCICTC